MGYVESIYRSNTLRIWPNSEPTKLLQHPKQNLGVEGASNKGLRHLLTSPFTGQFLRKADILGLVSFVCFSLSLSPRTWLSLWFCSEFCLERLAILRWFHSFWQPAPTLSVTVGRTGARDPTYEIDRKPEHTLKNERSCSCWEWIESSESMSDWNSIIT